MGWLERQDSEAIKVSKAFPDGMDATAQLVPRERKVSKVSKACKVSRAHKASKAHKASRAFRERQVLRDNPGAFCRRVSHRLARQIARLAKTEDMRSCDREDAGRGCRFCTPDKIVDSS